MKPTLVLLALATLYCIVNSKYSPAKVVVYSRSPGEFGEDNTLICHVSDFHPPDISIQLLKNGVELPNAQQTDLSFKQSWHFHLTRSVAFSPLADDTYSCKIVHGIKETTHSWDPNM